MQVSNTLIAVAVEIYLVLLIGAVLLFFHARQLKSIVRRQQEKIMALLKTQEKPVATPVEAPPPETYKSLLGKELASTTAQYEILAPGEDIGTEPPKTSQLLKRVLALRYAFLRAEELGTTEPPGSAEHWSIFEQALAPFLQSDQDNPALLEELAMAKKRIENLEKFKRLFFDMEKQWDTAKSNADGYYNQLMALSEGVNDRDGFNEVLDRYHNVYNDIYSNVLQVSQNPDSAPAPAQKTIHITRQDPRAADEIIKLRNVAADQHRIINQLQRKLVEAKTNEEKDVVIVELQQQLQRQIRFVQESETCIRLLEDELAKAHEDLSDKDRALGESSVIGEENERIKSTLQNFTLESMGMVRDLEKLEKENDSLKQNLQGSSVITDNIKSGEEYRKMQVDYMDLKKQYAELEEKYLDLKLGN